MEESTFYDKLAELFEGLDRRQPITQMSKKELVRQRGGLQEIIKLCKELRIELIEEKNRRYGKKHSTE